MTRCYIFDIDGTLADTSHRQHHLQKHPKDWDAFFADAPLDALIPHVASVLFALAGDGAPLVFVTGRPERYRDATHEWLTAHLAHRIGPISAIPLYMRGDGDRRDDDIIKLELLARIRADGYEPVMAFDDRTRVVRAWRAAGVPCAQVAEGDF